jgi:hypothetical protein
MNTIQAKIDAIRARTQRLRLLYGASYLLAVMLATVLGIASIDYLFKFNDFGVRLIFSLVAIGVALWAGYRFVWRSLRHRLSDVAISQQIEKQFPQLGDRLSSSVEFLRQEEDDALAGSAALRRAVITSTAADIESLDFSQALEPQPARKALRIAALASLSALLLAAINPTVARVALARLANPFGSDAFPRRTNLQIVGEAPTRLPVGQSFELHVADRDGNLPDEARLHLRFESVDGETTGEERSEPMQHLNDVLVARKENVTRPFLYRVTGGDDYSMPWTSLEVVEPPRVESLRIRLQPPAYTGWSRVPSDRQIQAIRGTRVELSATVTKPLKSAVLMQENGKTAPARIGKDGHTVHVPADPAQPFVIDQSGAYWLELTDLEGIRGGMQDRWEVRAVPDAAPTVSIERPAANQFVTPEAELPLSLLVKDDLAIRDVGLRSTRSENADVDDQLLELFQGPATPSAPANQTTAVPTGGESRTIEYRWRLAPLKLKPGTQLTFYAIANDYLPQSGQSPERRITIITPQELDERIAQRQATILSELGRVLKLEQEARAQVSDLQIQLAKVGALEKPDIDHAQAAELNQRVVHSTLTSDDRGLPAQIHDLLEELHTNKVDSPDIERLMSATLGELGRLDESHLTPLSHELTTAIKSARSELANEGASRKPAVAVRKAIDAAAVHQDAVIHSLEQLASKMSQWDNYRRFGREVAQLKRDQQELEAQTSDVAAKTLGQDRDSLRPQQQATVSKLAERQHELGRRFDKARQQMADMARSLQESDPLAAATLEDAAQQAGERGISGQMREAGKQLDSNLVSQARGAQRQIGRELDELLDILANRREQELSRLVKRLREAEHELRALRKQQAGLRSKFQEARQIQDEPERKRQLERLSREQKQLQEEAARFARKLERLQAEKAGRSAQSAAAKMSKASLSGGQGDGKEAEEQAEGAQKDLDESQQQLAERRQQAELDLAREQIARMQDGLKSLGEQQRALLAETERLEGLRQAQHRFTRPQIVSVRNLGRAERGLESETKAMAEKVASAEVFHLALETIRGEMGGAAESIESQHTGQPAQSRQQSAIRRIGQLLEAMKSASKPGGGNSGGQGGGQQPNAAAQDTIRALAEVKLLKLMQEDLNARFRELVARGDAGEELARLSQEQGKLAEMMQNFTRPAENPEDNPESLPDLRLEEETK